MSVYTYIISDQKMTRKKTHLWVNRTGAGKMK